MENLLVLTNISAYTYHSRLSQFIETAFSSHYCVTIIDIDSFSYDHQCYSAIQAVHPTILITMDLAGFRLRTQSGECALNMLNCKCLNLLWGNKPQYASYLNGKLSLSMIFYDLSGEDHMLPAHFPNMLYYKSSFCLLPVTSEKSSLSVLNAIWSDFTSEVLLS